jgi:hypothetical protein
MAARPISVRKDRHPVASHSQSSSIPEIAHFKVLIFGFFELI